MFMDFLYIYLREFLSLPGHYWRLPLLVILNWLILHLLYMIGSFPFTLSFVFLSLFSSLILHCPPQQVNNFTVELQAKPEYHKFLIGRGGANIRRVRDRTGARIIFPSPDEPEQELITIVGREEAVRLAQRELEILVKNLVRTDQSQAYLQVNSIKEKLDSLARFLQIQRSQLLVKIIGGS